MRHLTLCLQTEQDTEKERDHAHTHITERIKGYASSRQTHASKAAATPYIYSSGSNACSINPASSLYLNFTLSIHRVKSMGVADKLPPDLYTPAKIREESQDVLHLLNIACVKPVGVAKLPPDFVHACASGERDGVCTFMKGAYVCVRV